MTRESLGTHTRKELADMAKQRRLSGWHGMKKDELIDALLTLNASQNGGEQTSDTARETRRQHSAPSISNGKSNGKPLSTRSSSRSLATGSNANQVSSESDSLLAEAVEPTWIRAEWSITQSTVARAESALGAEWHRASPVIRVLDITSSESGMPNAVVVSEIPVEPGADRWYLNVKDSGRTYRLELGYLTATGRFFALVRSPKFDLPLDMSGLKKRQSTANRSLSHPLAPSSGLASSQDWDDEPADDFDELNMDPKAPRTRLQIAAEITVYGKGEPDALIDIADERIPLHPDGSFEIRLPLENGRQVLPIFATANGETRTIVLALERNTKELEPREAVEVEF
ncbi:MAG: DUF4912 domain-containing protein [Planctomycetota bacterium]|nr:DUF4912 domain-containing protein [Planctomycetota bacterium]